MTKLNGRCMCGAVTVEFEPAKPELGACHCEMCRRWTGSAFVEIDVKPGSLKYDGPAKTFASSDWAERAWCDTCGSTLWYHLTIPGRDFYGMSAGLVDDAGGLTLERENYIDHKPKGYAFGGDHKLLTKADFEAQVASMMAKEPSS